MMLMMNLSKLKNKIKKIEINLYCHILNLFNIIYKWILYEKLNYLEY